MKSSRDMDKDPFSQQIRIPITAYNIINISIDQVAKHGGVKHNL